MRGSLSLRLLGLSLALLAVFGFFVLCLHPWFQHWGATDDEVRRTLPGDEIIAPAGTQETRAVTIHARPAIVWSWLTQIGQDRGGFYSYDLLENLVGCEMPTVDRLQLDGHEWKIGDKLWMYPQEKAGGIGFATLRHYVPGHVLGFGTRAFGTALTEPENGSWTFVLEPEGDHAARLLVRGRMAPGRSLMWRTFDRILFDPAHFAMERRMLIGLKQIAEGSPRTRTANHLQVGLWAATFSLTVTAIGLVFRRDRWRRALVAFAASAVVFQILTFVQPSMAIGVVLVAAAAVILPWGKGPRGGEQACAKKFVYEQRR